MNFLNHCFKIIFQIDFSAAGTCNNQTIVKINKVFFIEMSCNKLCDCPNLLQYFLQDKNFMNRRLDIQEGNKTSMSVVRVSARTMVKQFILS